MSFALGFAMADLWRDRQERNRRQPVPTVSRATWEDEGEEWREQGDGAPDYTLPPGVHSGNVIYCAKCLSENRLRRERNEKLLEPLAIIRRRDSHVWCLRHDETFMPNFARFIGQFTVLPEL